MEKLTLEQLRTPGTKIPELSKTIKYTTTKANDNQYGGSISTTYGLVVYGTIFRNSEEHIITEVSSYTGTNFFQIPVSEFIRLGIIDEFVLPEKWKVLRTKDNYKIINEWFVKNGYGNPFISYAYIGINRYKNNYHSEDSQLIDYTEITFEQFKKYVLKDMDKKIIGYKCIKAFPGCSLGKIIYGGDIHFTYPNAAKEPEFFEPVYEQDKLTKVGKHEVQYLTEGVKIGCTVYPKESLKTALGVLHYTNIQDIRCNDGTIITKDIIEQLLKGLE